MASTTAGARSTSRFFPSLVDHPDHSVPGHDQVDGPPLDDGYPVAGFHGGDERTHDLGAGCVPVGMQDATGPVPSLTGEHQLPILVPIELGADRDEVLDRRRAAVGQEIDHPLDSQSTGDTESVIGMLAW